MAVKTPIRGEFSGSDLTGFAEFQASDFIGIADGGTGAITASAARTALGIAIGSDVQAFDAQLTDISGLTPGDGKFIIGDGSNFVTESGNTARASLGLGTSDSPTFNGLTLSGNLIVNGTTTTINSTTTTLDDPIMTLGGDTAPGSDDNKDRGIEFRWHNGSAAKLGFFGFDDSSGKFTFIPDATNTSEVFSGTAGTLVANLEGNVTGTVSSLSGLDTDNLSEGSSNLYFTNERVDDRVNALIIGGAGVDTAYDDSAGTLTLTADLSEVTSDLNERVDDRVGSLLVDSATSGIDIAYDDASDQLTISADLSEITSDLNERIDDQVNSVLTAGSNVSLTYDDAAGTLTIASTDTNTQLTTEEVQDIVGGMVDGGTETNVSVTYDDTNGKLNFVVTQLTSEQVQDIIGPMFASNTETFIDVAYDDSDGTLDLVVPVKDEDNMASNSDTHLATQQSIKAYVDSQIQTEESIEDFVGGMITGNTETLITVTYDDSDGTMDFVVDNDLANYDNTNSGFITATLTNEQVQDIVGAMFTSNTETNIAATYQDSDGTIDLVSTDTQLTSEQVQDIVGAMFSSNTETNITATYEDSDGTIDLVADLLTEEAVEDFVAGAITAGTNVSVTYDDAAGTITIASTDTNTQLTQEQVEDFVGGMLDGDETFITVAYDDTDGNIDFTVPVKDEDNMASDSASHLATQQSIKAYVDSQVTAQDLDFQADSGGALAIDLDSETLTFTGGTGIDTSGSGNAVTFAIDSTVVTESSSDTLTNKTLNLENNTVIVEYAVTAAGGKFVIDGQSQATISFRPGVVHRFDLSDSSVASHPFVLSETSEGTAYTTGRTASGTQGQANAYIEFTVNAATPDILYYYCSSHSGMGGTITVFGSAYGDADVQSYLSAGTGITLSGSGVIASSITQYADSDVQSYLSGGTGVTMSGSGEFSIGQAVATTSNVQFNNVQVDGVLTSNDITSTSISIDGNATITGNLTVEGTSTQVDSTTVTVADPLFKYAKDNTGNSVDIGFYGKYVQSATTKYAGLIWDASTSDKFRLFHGNQTEPSTTVDLSGTGHTTGTLIANLEGNVTGNVTGNVSGSSGSTTGNAATATALATGRTIGMTGDVVWTSASFDGSGNVTGTAAIQSDAVETAMVNSNVITGQSAYSGTVDTTNDFVLIYDHSTTSLKKIAVSDLNSASGAGTMSNFTIAADSGSNQVVADANTLTLTGGTGIDTSVGGTDEVTFALNTEAVQDIVGAMFSSNTETNITATYEDSDGTIDLVATGNTTEEIQDIVGAMFSSNTETNITATYQDSDGTIDLVASAGTVTEAFKTIAVSGQTDVVADSGTDTLTFAAGANITLTTDASNDTLTIAATGGAANAFSTLAVSGQSNVVADAATDTLTLVAGTGMTLTTDAGADSITFASSGGGGTMPFTEFDGSTDNIVLSSTATAGSLPVTLSGGSSDPIAMTATTQTLTSYADADNDTKVEVERTTDNDTVHIKAGGTDVITATATGVTITNLTVSGTTTQANELKITDTLFELNADGGSLTTDAGMIVERGSTGDNAALIWDESADSWVAGTTATDGSASSNLTVTEGDFKAKTQNQSDNSTKVATTAYVDTALGSLSSNSITDADSDTKIQVEESSDEDIIRADTAGQERVTIDNNVSMSARGGFFTHNATMHASETFTIASTEGTVAAGPLDVQGTVDVQGTLVVV